MIEHLIDYSVSFIQKPELVIASALSFALSYLSFILSRRESLSVKKKVFLLYLHIALLITPFAVFAYSVGCDVPVYDCDAKTIVYAIPMILAAITLIGSILSFFFAPSIYARIMKAEPLKGDLEHFVESNDKTVKLYLLDTAKPIAFSFSAFKSKIFISIGMMDLLDKKEVEAVLLHELGHIKNRSSWLKVSLNIARLLSPIARFADSTDIEELNADLFASTIQNTDKHIKSAREKLDPRVSF